MRDEQMQVIVRAPPNANLTDIKKFNCQKLSYKKFKKGVKNELIIF